MAANYISTTDFDPQYLTCLRFYWNGQIEQTKKSIIKAIASSDNPNVDVMLYRLWIEIASQERDTATLNMLKSHINQLADEGEYSSIYYSLIALIHYELDEIEAAELMLRGLEKETKNLYLFELEFWLSVRDADHQGDESWVSSCQAVDYIVIERVAKFFSTNNAFDRALALASIADKSASGSHLGEQVKLQLILNLENWQDSLELSKTLRKAFPGNNTFRYYEAYACFRLDRFQDVVSYLGSGEKSSNQMDPDSLNLLGHAYVELYKEKKSEQLFNRGLKVLNKSMEVLREMGLPIDYPSNQKMRLLNMKGHDVEITGNFWLAKLNAQCFSQIRTKSRSDIRYIRRPLGGYAKPGDLCFFVYEDKFSEGAKKIWRLGALYKVMDSPEWDPIHRFQNLLALQFMPEIAVPMNIESESQKAGAIHNPDDPTRFDVFQLDQAGFDAIIENVCMALGEEDSFSRILSELRTA